LVADRIESAALCGKPLPLKQSQGSCAAAEAPQGYFSLRKRPFEFVGPAFEQFPELPEYTKPKAFLAKPKEGKAPL
jgi:hypothetical protein